MADFSAIIERFKNNKYALPAVIGGTLIGGYFLIKNGGVSGGGSSGFTDAQAAVDRANQAANQAAGGASSGGGVGSDGSADASIIAAQQSNFMSGIVDAFNNLASQVQGALGDQAAQTQNALNSIAGQQAQYAGEFAAPGANDFTSLLPNLFGQLASFQQPQQQQVSPQLALNGQSFASQLQKIAQQSIRPVANASQNYLGSRAKPLAAINVQSFNRIASGAKTIIPNTRGSIVPQYNAPNIQSRGGFGVSKGAATNTANLAKLAAKTRLK